MSAVLKPISGGPSAPRHFLEIMDVDAPTLRRMLDLGSQTKRVMALSKLPLLVLH